MTRPPSGEWPATAGPADAGDEHDLLEAGELRAITAELTRSARPAPASLRAWVVAAAEAERAWTRAEASQPADRPSPTPQPQPIHLHGPVGPTRGHEEDMMADRTPDGTRLTTLPASEGLAAPSRPRAPRRRGGLARRWDRLGWPIVELIGAAALIVGLVAVLMGGSGGGGLPALVPGFGQATEVATPTAPAGEVAMAQGNAGRTGEMPGPGVLSDPALRWRADLGYPTTAISPQIVSSAGIVYAAVTNVGPSASDQSLVTGLRAIDAVDGSLRWDITTNAQAISAPVVAQGLVIVGIGTGGQPLELEGSTSPQAGVDAGAGYIVAFDALSGAERWRVTTGGIDSRDLTVADGKLYVADQAGTVQALDVTTGSPVWTTFIPPIGSSQEQRPMFSSVSVGQGTAILLSTTGDLYAYESATGAFRWTEQVTDGMSYSPSQTGNGPVIAGDSVLVPAFDGSNGPEGILKVFSIADGTLLWQVGTGLLTFSGLAVDGRSAYLAGSGDGGGGLILSMDLASGETDWVMATRRPLTTAPTVVDSTIYVGGRDWQLFALTTDDSGLRWSVAPLGEVTGSAYVADGTVYFSASDGYLYAVGGGQSPADLLDTQDPVVVSGAGACGAPSRVQRLDGDETPTPVQTPIPDFAPADPVRPFDPPAIRLADVQLGTPASPEAITGIQTTMDGLMNCAGPDDTLERDGFYSQAFFRRTGLDSASRLVDGRNEPWALGGRPVIVGSSNTATLPDGRTALIVLDPRPGEPTPYGTLYIFTVTNGVWSIDEQVLITPSGNSEIG